jgi:hypothetical protein
MRAARPRRRHADHVSWRDLVDVSPGLRQLERDARQMCGRRSQDGEFDAAEAWSSIRGRLSELVGWLAVDQPEVARSSDAYGCARRHLWAVLFERDGA